MDRHWIFKTALVSLAVILLLADYAESCRRRRRRTTPGCHNCRSSELVGAVSGDSRYACSNSYSPQSRCIFHCEKSGYSRCSNRNYCYTCQCDGNWTPKPINSQCCDVSRPLIHGCPGDITALADPNMECTTVSWTVPTVSDNSGETIMAGLISGLPPRSRFCQKKTTVRYKATDRAGNINDDCSFDVKVIVLTCGKPSFAAGSMGTMNCDNDKFIYGTKCYFDCDPGYCITGGTNEIQCSNYGTNSKPDVRWNSDAPTCTALLCSEHAPPANGYIVGGSCPNTIASQCEFGCVEGFTQSSSSPRTCTFSPDAGTCGRADWFGDEVTCRAATCPPLEEKPHALLTGCDGITDEAPIGTTCHWECLDGYSDVGNSVSTCTASGTWDNDNFECDLITCDSLPARRGHAFHSGCNVAPMHDFVGAQCMWRCDQGFIHSLGADVSNCLPDGEWDNNDFTCEAITCPNLNAMSQRRVNCTGNTVGSICQWSCISGYRGNGPSESTCLIDGSWDRLNFECEEIACESLLASYPVFHNECNDPPGTDPVGTVCRWYCGTGFYGDGPDTSQCQADGFWSNMDSFSCIKIACPDMDAPRNGALSCDTTSNVKFCKISCRSDSDIPRYVIRNNNFEQPYVCRDGVWNNPNYIVPDCEKTNAPTKVLKPVEYYYYLDKDCTSKNTIEDIKQQFKMLIVNSIYEMEYCSGNTTNCDVQNVEVICGPSDRKRRQVRRAAEKTSPVMITDARKLLKNDKNEKRRANILDKIKWHQSNDNPNFQGSNIHKRNSRHEFTVTFNVAMEFHPSEGGDMVAESWEAVDHLYVMMGDLNKMTEDGMMVPEIQGVELRLQDGYPMNYWDVEVAPVCDPGYVEASTSLLCSPCFEGTFNTNAECQGCPIGTYQDELAQTSCKPCPSGKSTVGTGSSNISDCQDMCQPGEYSGTGLAPCTKCTIGFYQSDERGTKCTPCPDGSSTLQVGSQSCVVKCLPGSSSATGFNPCDECSFNNYQPESGQTGCIPCPGNWITNMKGAVDESQCVVLQGGCVSYPCVNNARCVHYGTSAYYCVCDHGRDGQNCSSFSGARTDCGGTWIEPNGVLTSPNYPDHYRSNDRCAYFIKVPGAEQIAFYFNDFDSEIYKDILTYGSGYTVPIDTLERSDYIEGNLTSDNTLPGPISIVGDNAWFFWETDRNIEQRGFQLAYTACLHQDLPSVKNGEFSCSDAACSVMCDKGYDVRHGKTTVYRCINGVWNPSGNPANEIICENAKLAQSFKQTSDATLDSNMDCNDISYEETFTEGVYTYLNSTIFGEACDGKCFFDDLKFTCFQSHGNGRRKRQAQTPVEFIITMAITLNVDLNEAITIDEMNEDAKEMNVIMKKIVREIEDGTYLAYVSSNITMEPISIDGQPVEIGDVVPTCKAGYSRAAFTLTCIPCDVDTFESDGECVPCPRGQFQPNKGRTSCFSLYIPEE